MKKIWMLLGAAAMVFAAHAQSAYDALSCVTLDPVMGTARYSSMAGAFGAFGGNASTTKDNPAGVGVYKRFDISLTPSLNINNDKDIDFSLANFALIINFKNHTERERGYITSSLGITYNRLRNYSSYTSVADWDNSNFSLSDRMVDVKAPDIIFDEACRLGLVGQSEVENPDGFYDYESMFGHGYNIDKTCRLVESGRAGQWDFTYGLNISNRVYIGGGMGVASFSYSAQNEYDETSLNGNGDFFYLDNYYRAEAVGVNFKLGVIAKATNFMRFGFAVHTPTFYNVDEVSSIEMDYNNQYPKTPEIFRGEANYDLQTPFKLQASAGFVIAKRALIGLEYNWDNYKSMRLSKHDIKFENESAIIESDFKAAHTLKVGAEVKIIDEFALRAGYAMQTAPVNDLTEEIANDMFIFRSLALPMNSHYITGGCGYEGKHFYCDIAYMFRNQKTAFYQMLPQVDPKWDLNLKNHNLLLSFGWRF